MPDKPEDFGKGFVGKDFGLTEIGLLLKNLDAYNIALKIAGKLHLYFQKKYLMLLELMYLLLVTLHMLYRYQTIL